MNFFCGPLFSVNYELSEESTLKFVMICEAQIGLPATSVLYSTFENIGLLFIRCILQLNTAEVSKNRNPLLHIVCKNTQALSREGDLPFLTLLYVCKNSGGSRE